VRGIRSPAAAYITLGLTLLELLRDAVWQFVGAVLALLGVVVAIYLYWLQRQSKELAFGLLSSRRPLSIADELSSRVTVQLDGTPVGNLHLLVFGLKNSGHRAVLPQDFAKAFSIAFSNGKVVSAEIASQHPKNLGAQLTVQEHWVELHPVLLNPGDQLLVQILLSSTKPDWKVDARVVDIPAFAEINRTPKLPPFMRSGLFLPFLLALGFGLWKVYSGGEAEEAYVPLSFAAFIIMYSLGSRLVNESGSSVRRRIDET